MSNGNRNIQGMPHEGRYNKEKLFKIEKLTEVLKDYHVRLKILPPQNLPTVLLETFLIEIPEFGNENDYIKKHLESLPTEVQNYINKEFTAYVAYTDEKSLGKLAEATEKFFVTQIELAGQKACESDEPDKQAQREAISTMSKALRHYYGLQENDEELPCWSFSI